MSLCVRSTSITNLNMLRDVKFDTDDSVDCEGQHKVSRILLAFYKPDVARNKLGSHILQG
jgi:hypothetical protein